MANQLQLTADESGIITITLPNSQSIIIDDITALGIVPSDENWHSYNAENKVGY